MRIIICALSLATLAGCYNSSTTRTPAGTRKDRFFLAGMVSTSETDTVVAFERCRELLKPGHPNEQPMIDRDTFSPCFNNAMVGVEPRGQTASPAPLDLDGDGRPDAVRYPSGLQVPMNLYMTFPGVYWPGMYQYYGVPHDGWTPGPISYDPSYGAFGGAYYPPPAALGRHEYAGSLADPLRAGYDAENARADATYPEAAKNPQGFVRRNELRGLYKQTRANDAHVNAVEAEAQKQHGQQPAPKTE